MSKLTPLTPQDYELAQEPTIASQFPIVFENGNEMTTLQGYCARCSKCLDDDCMVGKVTRSYPKMALVEALGYCPDCKIFLRFLYRLYDDMRMTGRTTDGSWGEWRMRRSLKGWLRHIFTGKIFGG